MKTELSTIVAVDDLLDVQDAEFNKEGICMLHSLWTKWVHVEVDYIKSNTRARFPEVGFFLY